MVQFSQKVGGTSVLRSRDCVGGKRFVASLISWALTEQCPPINARLAGPSPRRSGFVRAAGVSPHRTVPLRLLGVTSSRKVSQIVRSYARTSAQRRVENAFACPGIAVVFAHPGAGADVPRRPLLDDRLATDLGLRMRKTLTLPAQEINGVVPAKRRVIKPGSTAPDKDG